MKFEEYVQSERVQEWKNKYASYKGLKKHVKLVGDAITSLNDAGLEIPGPQEAWMSSLLEQASFGEVRAIPAVESELDVDIGTYEAGVLGALERPGDEESQALLAGSSQDKRGKLGRGSVVTAYSLKRKESFRDTMRTLQKVIMPSASKINYGDMPLKAILMTRGIEAESQFFKYADKQVDKVEKFYVSQEAIAFDRFRSLADQLKHLADLVSSSDFLATVQGPGRFFTTLRHDVSVFTSALSQMNLPASDRATETQALLELNPTYPAVARKRISEALMEHYRLLQLLKSYRILNRMIFAKALKKFEETVMWEAKDLYFTSVVETSEFSSSKKLEVMIAAVENLFIALHGGDKTSALSKLRIPDKEEKDDTWTAFRVGMLWGLALIPLVSTVRTLVQGGLVAHETDRWLLLIYAAFFVPIFLLLLFCANVHIWTTHGINHVFIFELNPRKFLSPFEFMEIIGLVAFVWSTCLYFSFNNWLAGWGIAETMYPRIFLVSVLLMLLSPFKRFYRSARLWTTFTLLRSTILSGLSRVQFRDLFMADELVSCSYMFTGLATYICAERNNWTNLAQTCVLDRAWLIPVLTSIPNFFRFVQCVRRYFDTLGKVDQLVNAGKYAASTAVIVASFWSKLDGSWASWGVWIGCAVLSTVYSLGWDLLKDWALFQGGKEAPLLRKETTYANWFYYWAIVTNTILRCSFILVISPSYWRDLGVDGNLVAFGLALLEVCRRGQWNLLRVETEHASNTDNFRVVRDVPLPFVHRREETGHGKDYDEEDEDEEEDEVNGEGVDDEHVDERGESRPPSRAA